LIPFAGRDGMSYAIIGIISILATLKWGNLKKWKEYYPTILYFFVGNLTYMVLTQRKPLWYFGETLGHYTVFEITMMILLYPSTSILFLSYFPNTHSRMKCIMYITVCVLAFSAFEYLAHITGGISYSNGWNIFYSVIFNAVMFPLLILHFRRPLLVWPISAIIAFAFMFLFDIPFTK
jgi:hypothetical protein